MIQIFQWIELTGGVWVSAYVTLTHPVIDGTLTACSSRTHTTSR